MTSHDLHPPLSAGRQVDAIRAARKRASARIGEDHRVARRLKMSRHTALGVVGLAAATLSFVFMQNLASPESRLWWLAVSVAAVTAGMRELVDLMDLVVGDSYEPPPTMRSLTAIDRAVGVAAGKLTQPVRPADAPPGLESVRIVRIDGRA
jgi:hypothetical protein